VRNLFDQYAQPENKLTHALVCTLQREEKLIRPFLRLLKISKILPLKKKIQVVEQQIPGEGESRNENESNGVPDACFFDDDSWAVLVESKVQAGIRLSQLEAHAETAKGRGYKSAEVVLISVDRPKKLPEHVRAIEWREVYKWFDEQARRSDWAGIFTDYMRVFESQMIAKDYKIKGTITMFNGIFFDKKNPYNYTQGKVLLKLFRSELQKCKRLDKLGVNREADGHGAIKGSRQDHVWDIFRLEEAPRTGKFTDFPHLTIVLNRDYAAAAIVVPNAMKGKFFQKLKKGKNGLEGFKNLILEIEKQLRPIVKRTKAKPIIHLLQRHYPNINSPEVDADLEADLRTLVEGSASPEVKYQPEWLKMIYEVWVGKQSNTNIQLSVEVRFPYGCKEISSPKATELYAEAWKAISPLLKFVRDRN
jgi:hypothetical protein